MQNAEGEALIETAYLTDKVFWEAANGLSAEQASRVSVVTSIGLTDSPVNGAIHSREQ